jgi:hypothetical protein
MILLLTEHSLDPTVDLLATLALKTQFLAGCTNRESLQTQLLCLMHTDIHFPACLTLQAHLVLEQTPIREIFT